MTTADSDPLGEVDWDEVGGRRLPLRGRTVGFLLTTAVILAAWGYEQFFVNPALVPPWGWSPEPTGYLLYISLAVVVFYLVVPMARRPHLARRYWRGLKARPAGMVGLVGTVLFVLLGTFGPGAEDYFNIGANPANPYPPRWAQPPFFGTIPADKYFSFTYGGQTVKCVGEVTNKVCHGTMKWPLGTTVTGDDVAHLTVQGARVAMEIAFITGAIIVPLATLVGVAAAYYGGWVDEVLMRIVDIVQVIPAIFVVILVQQMFARRILTIIVLFGVLEWGSTARLVRSEALQRVEEDYVTAARSAGLSDFAAIRKHVIPNVSSTVITSVTFQMPNLIIIEAAISYLGWGDPLAQSWGATINAGLVHFPTVWWTPIFPALGLILTAVSLHLLGDAMRDVLDPRLEGE